MPAIPGDPSLVAMVIGVSRAVLEFLQGATSCKRPRVLAAGVPPALKQCVKSIVDMGCAPWLWNQQQC